MNEFTEVTAENLKFLRGAKGLNQDEVAAILGIGGNQISKIEKGIRALSAPEKSLLDLYFFGKMPFAIVSEKLLGSVLEFTPDQWRVISIMATKSGAKSPGQWIADKIRDFLAFSEEARSIAKPPTSHGLSLVAEDPAPYGKGKDKAK